MRSRNNGQKSKSKKVWRKKINPAQDEFFNSELQQKKKIEYATEEDMKFYWRLKGTAVKTSESADSSGSSSPENSCIKPFKQCADGIINLAREFYSQGDNQPIKPKIIDVANFGSPITAPARAEGDPTDLPIKPAHALSIQKSLSDVSSTSGSAGEGSLPAPVSLAKDNKLDKDIKIEISQEEEKSAINPTDISDNPKPKDSADMMIHSDGCDSTSSISSTREQAALDSEEEVCIFDGINADDLLRLSFSRISNWTLKVPQRLQELIHNPTEQEGYESDFSITSLCGEEERTYAEARQEVKTIGDEFELWTMSPTGEIEIQN